MGAQLRLRRPQAHLHQKSKQLILKSPDNTARIRELWGMYPDARFINIHRDPYKTVRSTIHMFRTEMDSLRLTEEPDNIDELIENTVIDIFERMYRELFELEGFFPKNRYVDIAYTDFCRAPSIRCGIFTGVWSSPALRRPRRAFRRMSIRSADTRRINLTFRPGSCARSTRSWASTWNTTATKCGRLRKNERSSR